MARMRSLCLAAVVGGVLVLMSMTDFVAATDQGGSYGDLSKTLSGRKFSIYNIFPVDGLMTCPNGNPNSVAFHPSGSNPYEGTVTIAGDFDAANIGVCYNPPGDQYAVAPGTVINYYIYGDWVIWRIAGRTASASKFVFQQGKLSAVGVANTGTYYVSELTDYGYA